MRFLTIPVLLLFVNVLPVSAENMADGPWIAGSFAGTPREILAAAGKIPIDEKYEAQILLEEKRFVLDQSGRVDSTYRLIYRVDSPGAIPSWSRVSETWRPWYQDRPEIEARVIAPDGSEYRLNPADLGEYNDAEDGPQVYGDEKTLKGPLPAVEVGAIVEEIHRIRDRESYFPAGVVGFFSFGASVPVRKSRVILDAPAAIPMKYVVHRLPGLEPARETKAGRIRLHFETGLLEPHDEDLDYAPADIARRPVLRFSTGSSWNSIASSYSDIVDVRIRAGELRKLSAEIAGDTTNRDEKINRFLSFLKKNVRYTGVEFGDGSIVPSTPMETLERRFGDCKDKATALVALLREAGIESFVALLNTGPGNDTDPELPGMGRFDHAIVHIPSNPELWIDPTDVYARLGELPDHDQGRLALVASHGTIALVRTPQSVPAQNVQSEEREVFLAIEGGGRIVETTTVSGSFERSYRRTFGRNTEKENREQLGQYLKNQFQAQSLGEIHLSDTEDLSIPMSLRIEGKDCGKLWTAQTAASVPILAGNLIGSLPDILKPDDSDTRKPEKERKYPVLLQTPYVMEILYRIHPPPGYAVASVPENGKRFFGPAVMTQEYETSADSVVTARLRFDTVKALYSTEEAVAVKSEIGRFYQETTPQAVFHHVGEAHLQAGRIPEALKEFQGLVERFPDTALFRTQVARAYLEAGLGGNARREASRAVELAPESLVAQRTLGIILAHDELGRKFMSGFNYQEAETALRKAREIDPKDFSTRGELAILLEHDADGHRYGPGSRLDEAISEYTFLRSDLKIENLTTNLMVALLNRSRFAELRELWKEAPKNSYRNGLYLAATAVVNGTDEAVREGSRIADQAEAYREILGIAGNLLTARRYYPEAAELLSASARGASDSVARLSLASFLRDIRRHEPADLQPDDPEDVIRAFTLALLSGKNTAPEELHRLFPPFLTESIDIDRFSGQMEALREVFTRLMNQQDVSEDQVLDMMFSPNSISLEGNPETGYRARLKLFGIPAGNNASINMYLFRSENGYRIVGLGRTTAVIGKLLLRWIEEDRKERVRQWLDWLTEDTFSANATDVLDRTPLEWIWTEAGKNNRERMRLAAASLMDDGTYGEFPVRLIQKGIRSNPGGDINTGLNIALANLGRSTDKPEILLKAAESLLKAHPRSLEAFELKILALEQLKRFVDAEQELSRRMERQPGEPMTASLYAEIPRWKGDFSEHRGRLASLIQSGRATAMEYNNLAWLDVMQGSTSADTLQNAQHAVTLTNHSDAASLHTLATVYAELGHVTEARDVLMALLKNRASRELESPDWYIIGRIGELYGVPDAAIEAYEKVEPPAEGKGTDSSTYAIASRRLRALGKDPGK